MVSDAAFERVSGYLQQGKVRYGGHVNTKERFIEPTLLDDVQPDAEVLTTEIFGPVLPIVTLDDPQRSFEDQVVEYVTAREKPLALYYFGAKEEGWSIVGRTSSGGCCINDTIMHIVNPNIPFGGVGNSGMGHYHGLESFEAFTHRRAVVATPTWFDLPFRYMPYKRFKLMKRMM
jgi:aldehyde dehydrogenase (NAD+)